jgi:hypothetical protein
MSGNTIMEFVEALNKMENKNCYRCDIEFEFFEDFEIKKVEDNGMSY